MELNLPESVLEALKKVWKEQWKKLTLADDFIFSRIMQNTEVCKEVLEMLLKIKISHIEFPVAQKVIQTLKASKGVRMDVYVQEPDGQRVFDIEMQSVITKEEALRARYYQGMLDLDNLLKGSDYVELPQTYIIFLCMSDPFGLNLPIYEPHSYMDPQNQHPYDDKTKKIFYNVSRYHKVADPRIKDFLQYLQSKTPTNDFTRRLDHMVEELKTIEMGFSDYIAARQKEFDWLRQGKEQGYAEGIATGREEGISIGLATGREEGISIGLERGAYQTKLETARSFLAMGLSPEQVTLGTSLPLETVLELAQTK